MGKYFALFKETYNEFSEDKAQRLAAALAYYTLFSIAPLLLVCIAIAGLVFGNSQAQAQIIGQIHQVMGDAGGKAIQEMLVNAAKPKTGTIAIVIGAITLLLGAAGVFGQLKDALNTIWNVPEKKGGGIVAMLKERFLSFAMVLGVGFLLLVSLVIDAALSAISSALWQPVQLIVSFAVVTLLFAMIFRFLPDTHPRWRDVWLGAAFTAFLFVLGKFALGLYLGKSAVGSAYGAAGSLVVLLGFTGRRTSSSSARSSRRCMRGSVLPKSPHPPLRGTLSPGRGMRSRDRGQISEKIAECSNSLSTSGVLVRWGTSSIRSGTPSSGLSSRHRF